MNSVMVTCAQSADFNKDYFARVKFDIVHKESDQDIGGSIWHSFSIEEEAIAFAEVANELGIKFPRQEVLKEIHAPRVVLNVLQFQLVGAK